MKLIFEPLKSRFSVCKVSDFPEAVLKNDFCFISVTDDEKSLVCPAELAPENALEEENGWRGFRIAGKLDFSLVGILARISAVLAENEIGIFVISTFNTDYIFVKEENFEKALEVLNE